MRGPKGRPGPREDFGVQGAPSRSEEFDGVADVLHNIAHGDHIKLLSFEVRMREVSLTKRHSISPLRFRYGPRAGFYALNAKPDSLCLYAELPHRGTHVQQRAGLGFDLLDTLEEFSVRMLTHLAQFSIGGIRHIRV